MKNLFLFSLVLLFSLSTSTFQSNIYSQGKPECGFGYFTFANVVINNGSTAAQFDWDFSNAVVGYNLQATLELRADPYENCGGLGESTPDYGLDQNYNIPYSDLINGQPFFIDHQIINRKSFRWRLVLRGWVGTGRNRERCLSATEWECFTFSD